MPKLNNKTSPVTGASRGIGRATTHAPATAGAHVLVHFGNAKTEAESAVSIQDALIGSFALSLAVGDKIKASRKRTLRAGNAIVRTLALYLAGIDQPPGQMRPSSSWV